eukprot:534205_1
MSFPRCLICPDNTNHAMYRSTVVLKRFIKGQYCSKCTLPLNHIYFSGRLVIPHYYHCGVCNHYLCINCAHKNNKLWHTMYMHPSAPVPSKLSLMTPTKIKDNYFKISRFLDDLDDNILIQCMDDISNVFGGHREILKFILKNAPNHVADQFYQLMLNKHQDNTINSIQNSIFESIPNECMSHIIDYLNRHDIRQFKLSSKSIAHACLQEMKKVHINYINGNKILNNTDMDAWKCRSVQTEYRFRATKRWFDVYEHWNKHFEISMQNQLLFYHTPWCLQFVDSEAIKTNLILSYWGRHNLLILDKTKIVIMDENGPRMFDVVNDSPKHVRSYKPIILKYFDINTQSIQVVQYILCKDLQISSNTLLDYIQFKYIQISNVDNQWYYKLMQILKQMRDDVNEHKLCIYKYEPFSASEYMIKYESPSTTPLNSTNYLFTFQINPNHSWSLQTDLFNPTNETFEINCNDFCTYWTSTEFFIRTNSKMLTRCIQHYYKTRLNKQQQKLFKYDIQSVLDVSMLNCFRIKIYCQPYTTIGVISFLPNTNKIIKTKMSKILGNIVSIKNIEIVSRSDCYIVFTPSVNLSDHESCLYNVRIFTPDDCFYPCEPVNVSDDIRILTIKYKKQFQISAFINDIFDTIYKSRNHILYYAFKELIEFYFNIKDAEKENHEDCDMKQTTPICFHKNDEFEYILSKAKYRQLAWKYPRIKQIEAFRKSDTYNNMITNAFDSGIATFDLHIIPIKPYKTTRNIKLKIKFRTSDRHDYIGLPLIAWINKRDTLQYVVNKYMKKSIDYIQSCYKIRNGNKTVISRPRWNEYNNDISKPIME